MITYFRCFLQSMCHNRQFRVAYFTFTHARLDFGLMNKHIAFVKAVDREVNFVRCNFNGVLWQPFAHFLLTPYPQEKIELPEKASAVDARMSACDWLKL